MNFAIIGCGNIAPRHAHNITQLANLKAVCDIKPDRADALAQEFKATAYYSLDDLLTKEKEIDVVSICTPNGRHAEHSIKALSAGFHVVCEKPMALYAEDCQKMIEVADKADKKIFVVKQNRFNPPVAAVKKVIDEGYLGKIFNIQLNCFWNRNSAYFTESDWKGKKEVDGGTLYTQFSHFIDLLYWLAGDVEKVCAFTQNFVHQDTVEFEDCGAVALKFKSGALGTINFTIGSYKKNMEGSLTVFGEKGTVKIGGQYLNELEYQNIENFKIKNLPAGNPPNQYGHYQGSMSNHGSVYKNILAALSGKEQILTKPQEAMKTVEIIEKIYLSAK